MMFNNLSEMFQKQAYKYGKKKYLLFNILIYLTLSLLIVSCSLKIVSE